MEKKEFKTVFGMMFKSTRERNGSTFWSACAGMMITLLPYFVLACLGFLLREKVEWMWIVCVCVGALLLGPLQYGYIRFYNKLTTEGNANIFMIYDWWHMENFVMVTFGGLLEAIVVIVCASFVIVPIMVLNSTIGAIIAAVVATVILVVLVAFFSMVFFFIDHHKYESFAEALKTCFVRMRRNRMSMMSYKVLYYVFFLIIAFVAFILGSRISLMFGTSKEAWGLVFAIIGMAFLFVVVVFMMAWYHASNHLYFEQILDYHEKKRAKKEALEAAKAEEVKEEEKVEVEEEKIVAPTKLVAPKKAAATKKTTTKKAAPKKAAPKKVAEVKVEETVIEAPTKIEAPKKTTTKKVASTKTTTSKIEPPKKTATKKVETKIEPPKKAPAKKAVSKLEPPKKATKTTKTTK